MQLSSHLRQKEPRFTSAHAGLHKGVQIEVGRVPSALFLIFPKPWIQKRLPAARQLGVVTARVNPPTFTSEVIGIAIAIKSCSIVHSK